MGAPSSSAFPDLAIEARDGITELTAEVEDCEQLYALQSRLSDFAIQVISLREENPG